MNLEKLVKDERVKIGVVSVFSFALATVIAGYLGLLGVRGTEKVYSFTYNGRPGIIQRTDNRFGEDEFYITINGKDKLWGELTTDEGNFVKVDRRSYKVGR